MGLALIGHGLLHLDSACSLAADDTSGKTQAEWLQPTFFFFFLLCADQEVNPDKQVPSMKERNEQALNIYAFLPP